MPDDPTPTLAVRTAEMQAKLEPMQLRAECVLQSTYSGAAGSFGNVMAKLLPALLQLLTDLDKDRVQMESTNGFAVAADYRARFEASEEFKAFVHSYLDQHDVPHGDPENEHQKQGCRIGARLDLLFAERDAARRDAEALAGAMEIECKRLLTPDGLCQPEDRERVARMQSLLAAHNAGRANGEGT